MCKEGRGPEKALCSLYFPTTFKVMTGFILLKCHIQETLKKWTPHSLHIIFKITQFQPSPGAAARADCSVPGTPTATLSLPLHRLAPPHPSCEKPPPLTFPASFRRCRQPLGKSSPELATPVAMTLPGFWSSSGLGALYSIIVNLPPLPLQWAGSFERREPATSFFCMPRAPSTWFGAQQTFN